MYKLSLIFITLITASSKASRQDRSIARTRGLLDSEFNITWPNFEPEIPEHCQNQNICEDVPNYPHEYIDHLKRHNDTVRSVLSFMMGGYQTPQGCSRNKEYDVENLCSSRIAVVFAKAARAITGGWHHVVTERHLCVELCNNQNTPCDNKNMNVATGYETICKQKHVTGKMTVLDENGSIKLIPVPLPNGCCCHIKDKKPPGYFLFYPNCKLANCVTSIKRGAYQTHAIARHSHAYASGVAGPLKYCAFLVTVFAQVQTSRL